MEFIFRHMPVNHNFLGKEVIIQISLLFKL